MTPVLSQVVGWLTSDMTAGSSVQFGTSPGAYTGSATGTADSYTFGSLYTSGLIHHVALTGLKPATRYYYIAGSASAWSAEASFVSSPGVGPDIPHTFAVIADIGENANANATVTRLLTAFAAGQLNSGLLSGDISYASGCEAIGCKDWDAFQRMMDPLTRSLPFQISIGEVGGRGGRCACVCVRARAAGPRARSRRRAPSRPRTPPPQVTTRRMTRTTASWPSAPSTGSLACRRRRRTRPTERFTGP